MIHKHQNTTKALLEAHTGSLRQLQRKLNCGVSIGTLSRVLNGQPVSLQSENRIGRTSRRYASAVSAFAAR